MEVYPFEKYTVREDRFSRVSECAGDYSPNKEAVLPRLSSVLEFEKINSTKTRQGFESIIVFNVPKKH